MKKILVLVAVMVPLLFACNAYDLGGSLKSDVYIMFTGPNGLDQITYTFGDDGVSGEWEEVIYTFGAADAASVSYDLKSWFRTGGAQGTFTYDNDTKTLTLTYSAVFEKIAGAAASYAADYAYYTLGDGDAGTMQTVASTVAFTQDGAFAIYLAVEGAENTWVSTTNMTEIGGGYENETHTYVIAEGTVSDSTLNVSNGERTADQTAENTNTISDVSTLGVTNYLVAGGETGDVSWARVWKKGNVVSISYDRTLLEIQDYLGSQDAVRPTAAEIVVADGNVTNDDGADDSWRVDERRGVTTGNNKGVGTLSFVHAGDYIYDARNSIAVARSAM